MFNNMLGNDVLRLLTQSSSQFMHNWEKATRLQLSCFCCSSSCSRRERHRVRCFIMTCICHLVLVLYLMLIRLLHDFHSRFALQYLTPECLSTTSPASELRSGFEGKLGTNLQSSTALQECQKCNVVRGIASEQNGESETRI